MLLVTTPAILAKGHAQQRKMLQASRVLLRQRINTADWIGRVLEPQQTPNKAVDSSLSILCPADSDLVQTRERSMPISNKPLSGIDGTLPHKGRTLLVPQI
jgi:hypothetical protein